MSIYNPIIYTLVHRSKRRAHAQMVKSCLSQNFFIVRNCNVTDCYCCCCCYGKKYSC